MRPDHVYTLTESDVPGYEFSRLQQFVGGVWVDVVANPNPAGYPQQDGAGNWQITVAGLDSPVYRFVNDDIAPILTLIKTVTNDNGGTALPTAWTLTATAPGGPHLTGTTGSADVTAQPVRAGVAYTIGESGPAPYVWNTLSCTGYPGTTQAAPTITLQPGDDVTCTLNNNDILVPVTVAKADGAVQQLADGDWSISYQVVVTNPSATLPTTYSLTDVPAFDSSFTILSQGWQGDPDVTDIAIEAGGTDTYTYVVTAEANETPVDPTALVCSPTGGGGFFNTATVTFPGGADSDTGCAVPAKPAVQKTALESVQDTTTGAVDAQLRGSGLEPDRDPARLLAQRHRCAAARRSDRRRLGGIRPHPGGWRHLRPQRGVVRHAAPLPPAPFPPARRTPTRCRAR